MRSLRFAVALGGLMIAAGVVGSAMVRNQDAPRELPCGMNVLAYWREHGAYDALTAAGAEAEGMGPDLQLYAPDLKVKWGEFSLKEVAFQEDGMTTFFLRATADGPRVALAVPEDGSVATSRARFADALEGLTLAPRANREAAFDDLTPAGVIDAPSGRWATYEGRLNLPLNATPLYERFFLDAPRVGGVQPGLRVLERLEEGISLSFVLPIHAKQVTLDDKIARLEADPEDHVSLSVGARGLTIRISDPSPLSTEMLAREALAEVGLADAELDAWRLVGDYHECIR